MIIEDNFSYFSLKPYVVSPNLVETVQVRGHNICFYPELTKIIHYHHQVLPLIKSSELIFSHKFLNRTA